VKQAASLATNAPAEHKLIESLAKMTIVQHYVVKSVFVDDPTRPKTALATSEVVNLTQPEPNGQREFSLVLSLSNSTRGWHVTDILFRSEEGAEVELKRFREANPSAFECEADQRSKSELVLVP
jgi:hypothetical protein